MPAAHKSNNMSMLHGAYRMRDNTCLFSVWAPCAKDVAVKIMSSQKVTPMVKGERGYWQVTLPGVMEGARYVYILDGKNERPDPASFCQPDGVHGASALYDHNRYDWHDSQWKGVPLSRMIMYELHVGTFTPEGTFEAVIPRLGELKDMGITAIEIMPVAQFPGGRNWGYDGVYPFAVQSSYGGPDGLKRLVGASHAHGIAVILDVVYNHLGPEGNVLRDFGPYFTDRYKTPWGEALNFDGQHSDGVRDYIAENALYWFHYFHIDALRLDAVHGIFDMSARHILAEIDLRRTAYCEGRRQHYLIAESDLNDVRVITPRERGGYGMDAQWSDDFHHAVHALLTEEKTGYYGDFGKMEHLAKSLSEGFVYDGKYSPFRKRYHGSSSAACDPACFVACIQNHDQIGNRMNGERLSALTDFESLKLAAGILLTSPYIPLIFMGQEYAEKAPFLYFISHEDLALVEAVRRGRTAEFSPFEWKGTPPDPYDTGTFTQSVLQWELKNEGVHKVLRELYREMIAFRTSHPALSHLTRAHMRVESDEHERVLLVERSFRGSALWIGANFSEHSRRITCAGAGGTWKKRIDTADNRWHGPGSDIPRSPAGGTEISLSAKSLVIFEKG